MARRARAPRPQPLNNSKQHNTLDTVRVDLLCCCLVAWWRGARARAPRPQPLNNSKQHNTLDTIRVDLLCCCLVAWGRAAPPTPQQQQATQHLGHYTALTCFAAVWWPGSAARARARRAPNPSTTVSNTTPWILYGVDLLCCCLLAWGRDPTRHAKQQQHTPPIYVVVVCCCLLCLAGRVGSRPAPPHKTETTTHHKILCMWCVAVCVPWRSRPDVHCFVSNMAKQKKLLLLATLHGRWCRCFLDLLHALHGHGAREQKRIVCDVQQNWISHTAKERRSCAAFHCMRRYPYAALVSSHTI